jgi:branched-chain amino acid aminotransferase
MVQPTKYIWMDGELVSWDKAQVHVLSYTMHYGLGAFEGIRSYQTGPGQGAVFRLPEHSERLVDSMQLCNLNMEYTPEDVSKAVTLTFEANDLVEGYARPLAYVGSGGMGLFAYKNPVHLAVAVWRWGAYLGEEGRQNGIRCCISSFQRLHGTGILTKGKIPGHYVNSILAKEEAIRNGYDEGLMVDYEGHVLEGTGENLFIVKGNEILTPPLQAAILGGVTRDTIIKLAQEMGYTVVGKLFGRDTIYLADEVFLTGTAAEVTPVREVDGRSIGTGQPGPVTRALMQRYDEVVSGKSPEHDHWLTHYKTQS